MLPELFEKWGHIIDDIDKTKIPVIFVEKIVMKLNGANGKKQKTVNIRKLIKRGLDDNEIEEVVKQKLEELDDEMVDIEFVLDIEGIANAIQPQTDDLLKNL